MNTPPSTFSDEDRAILRDAVARFVTRQKGPRRPSSQAPNEGSTSLWKEITELGLHGLLVDEQEGGIGGGDEDLSTVMEMFGHGLVVEPFMGTAVLGATLLSGLADATQRQRWLRSLIDGSERFALAHFEAETGFHRDPGRTRAEDRDGYVMLTGEKSCVVDAPVAGVLIVSALEGAGRSLFALRADTPGLVMRAWTTVDGRPAADLLLDAVRIDPTCRIGAPGDAAGAIDRALDRATLAIGSDALGSMQSLLAQTREHLRTRKQFGQPLSGFQVLQHRLVDMYMAIEESRAMLAAARASLAEDTRSRTAAVAASKYKVGQAARLVGEHAVQLHGAMGMTDELPVSHHFKRLLFADALFGDSDFQLARFSATGASMVDA